MSEAVRALPRTPVPDVAEGGNGVATGEWNDHSGDGQVQETNGSAPIAIETEDEPTDLGSEIDGEDGPPEDLLTADETEE